MTHVGSWWTTMLDIFLSSFTFKAIIQTNSHLSAVHDHYSQYSGRQQCSKRWLCNITQMIRTISPSQRSHRSLPNLKDTPARRNQRQNYNISLLVLSLHNTSTVIEEHKFQITHAKNTTCNKFDQELLAAWTELLTNCDQHHYHEHKKIIQRLWKWQTKWNLFSYANTNYCNLIIKSEVLNPFNGFFSRTTW